MEHIGRYVMRMVLIEVKIGAMQKADVLVGIFLTVNTF